jgi:diguanylate cyclase (GGDEF)-like protein
MPSNEPSSRHAKVSDLWSCLEPYAQLAQMMLPRMSGLTVLNGRGDILWSNEIMAVNEAVRRQVTRALLEANRSPESPGQFIDPGDGDALYVFWLRQDKTGGTGAIFAAVSIRCRNESGGDARPFATVNSLVRPAIDCLRREVVARREITELQSTLAEHDGDLEMLLEVAGNGVDGRDEGGDDLKSIVASAAEHIDVGLAVLIVPEKNLVLVQPSGDEPLDAGLIARAHRHLLSMAQTRREAVIENRIKLHVAEEAPPYRILSCPVARGDGSTIGVLAMFRSSKRPEFNHRHTRLIELIARRLGTIIASNYDPTTGLLTRALFERRVRQALEATQQPASRSALYIDVNRMHVINDTHGMHTGDKVLTRVGELLRQRMPPGGIAGRISGDRFAALLPADIETAAAFAESVRAGVEQLGMQVNEGALPVTVSIGVALVETGHKEYAAAFAPAETACKTANDRGRNRVDLFQRSDETIIRRYKDISVVGELRAAIVEGRLRLHAQPLAPLGSIHRVPHFEILLRVIDDKGQTVGPYTFLSAAQRYQMMPEIDRAVITLAMQMLQPYARQLEADPAIFTINFSGQSLQEADFGSFIASTIERSGIRPDLIAFELTESAAVGDIGRAETLIRSLRQMGCGVALDDFGTGLSSLSYLRALPINMLKIDGSFVRDVLTDSRAESMIEAVAYLARSMKLITVAEYVETPEIRARVAHLGVDYAQGYAIGRPTPLSEVLDQIGLYTTFARLDSSNTRKLSLAV